jgi:hypothetical protein
MATARVRRPAAATLPTRFEHARRRAEAEGMLADKGGPTTVRIPQGLLEAARRKLGLERTSDVVTAALSHVVYEDDFGEYLLSLQGQGGPDYMAELDRDEREDGGRP